MVIKDAVLIDIWLQVRMSQDLRCLIVLISRSLHGIVKNNDEKIINYLENIKRRLTVGRRSEFFLSMLLISVFLHDMIHQTSLIRYIVIHINMPLNQMEHLFIPKVLDLGAASCLYWLVN